MPDKPRLPQKIDPMVRDLATSLEVQARCQAIMDLICTNRWCRREENRLAKEWGVVTRTVRGYKKRVVDALKSEHVDRDRESYRAEISAQLDAAIVQASESGDTKAVFTGLRLKSQIHGVLNTPAPVIQVGVRVGTAAPAQLIHEIVQVAPIVSGLLPTTVHEDDPEDIEEEEAA